MDWLITPRLSFNTMTWIKDKFLASFTVLSHRLLYQVRSSIFWMESNNIKCWYLDGLQSAHKGLQWTSDWLFELIAITWKQTHDRKWVTGPPHIHKCTFYNANILELMLNCRFIFLPTRSVAETLILFDLGSFRHWLLFSLNANYLAFGSNETTV